MSRLSLAFLCLAALTLTAQTPTIDQSLSMKQIAGVEISPDARFVAYVVQQANWDENSFENQLNLEYESQRMAGAAEDFKEGVTAFLEKRPAKFKGK